MSGLTGQGFPYPEGDDPITDYPALALLLAEEVDKRHRSGRFYGAPATPPGGGYVAIPIAAVDWEDWDFLPAPGVETYFGLNVVGRFRITSTFQWIGQTGGVGWNPGRIRHWNSGGVEQASAYGGCYGNDVGFTISMIFAALAGDYFQVEAASNAGAAGGTCHNRTIIERLK